MLFYKKCRRIKNVSFIFICSFEMDAGGSVSLLLEPVSGLDIRNCICYMACLYENNVDIREDMKCIVIYIYSADWTQPNRK